MYQSWQKREGSHQHTSGYNDSRFCWSLWIMPEWELFVWILGEDGFTFRAIQLQLCILSTNLCTIWKTMVHYQKFLSNNSKGFSYLMVLDIRVLHQEIWGISFTLSSCLVASFSVCACLLVQVEDNVNSVFYGR